MYHDNCILYFLKEQTRNELFLLILNYNLKLMYMKGTSVQSSFACIYILIDNNVILFKKKNKNIHAYKFEGSLQEK